MNKDALLATLIGLAAGLVITGVLLLGPSLTKSFPKLSLPRISLPSFAKPGTPSPTPTPAQELTVTIDSPLAEEIAVGDTLLVSGTTLPTTTVVAQGPLDEDVVLTRDGGAYAAKVSLIEGSNEITVTAYKDGKSASQTVTVFYTPEEF